MTEKNKEIIEGNNKKSFKLKSWHIIGIIIISTLALSGFVFEFGSWYGRKQYRKAEYNSNWLVENSCYYVEVVYLNNSEYFTIEYNRLWMEQPDLLYLAFWDNDPYNKKSYESIDLYVGNESIAYQLINVSFAFIYYRSLRINLKWELYSWTLDLSTDTISNPKFIEGQKNVRNGTFLLEEFNVTYIEYRIKL
ncbi:MAG: hypothetical protein HZR80_12555 [Candidatus Heimdallarchaeota archaeon]